MNDEKGFFALIFLLNEFLAGFHWDSPLDNPFF